MEEDIYNTYIHVCIWAIKKMKDFENLTKFEFLDFVQMLESSLSLD